MSAESINGANAFVDRALDVRERWTVATRMAGCCMLLSEDLQHGQKLRGLTIIHPFQMP